MLCSSDGVVRVGDSTQITLRGESTQHAGHFHQLRRYITRPGSFRKRQCGVYCEKARIANAAEEPRLSWQHSHVFGTMVADNAKLEKEEKQHGDSPRTHENGRKQAFFRKEWVKKHVAAHWHVLTKTRCAKAREKMFFRHIVRSFSRGQSGKAPMHQIDIRIFRSFTRRSLRSSLLSVCMDLLAKSRFTSWISVIFSSTELAQMNLITRTFASGTTDELTAF